MALDLTIGVGEIAYGSHDPLVIPVPTGTGGLLIAAVYSDDAEITVTPPTALGTWTNVADLDHSGASMDLRVYYKLDNGETTSVSFDLSGSAASEGKLYRITGNDTGTPIDATTVVSGVTSEGTTATFPTITTVTDNAALVGIGCNYSGGVWAPSGSPALTERDDAVGAIWVGSAILATAGASGTRTCSCPNSKWLTVMMAIRPDGGAPATVVKDVIGNGIIPWQR